MVISTWLVGNSLIYPYLHSAGPLQRTHIWNLGPITELKVVLAVHKSWINKNLIYAPPEGASPRSQPTPLQMDQETRARHVFFPHILKVKVTVFKNTNTLEPLIKRRQNLWTSSYFSCLLLNLGWWEKVDQTLLLTSSCNTLTLPHCSLISYACLSTSCEALFFCQASLKFCIDIREDALRIWNILLGCLCPKTFMLKPLSFWCMWSL